MGIEAQRAVELGQELSWAQKRRLHRSLNYRDYVWGWSVRMAAGLAVFGCFLFAAVMMALDVLAHMPSTWEEKAFVALTMGVASGGAGMAWALIWRAVRFDALMEMEWDEVEFAGPQQPEQQAEGSPERWIKMNGDMSRVIARRGKTVQYGDDVFTFQGKTLDKMRQVYLERKESGQQEIARDAVGFSSQEWPVVLRVLAGRGLIDDQKRYTPKGVGFLTEE